MTAQLGHDLCRQVSSCCGGLRLFWDVVSVDGEVLTQAGGNLARTSEAHGTSPNGDMGPRGACPKDVDVAVEKGGAGGETKAPGAYVDKGLETMAVWGRLRIEVTPGSATSWDRPVERSYLVRVRRDEFSVVVGWGLSRRSAESLAERLIELLGPGSPVPGRPAA